MRGEKLFSAAANMQQLGSPPHARGKAFYSPFVSRYIRITPACAGKRLTAEDITTWGWDHPRMRGEKGIL